MMSSNNFFFTLTLRPYFNQDKVIIPLRLQVGVAGIKAEIIGIEFQHALKFVSGRYAGGDQAGVHGVQYGGFEFAGLRFADGEGDEGHGGSFGRERIGSK